MRVILLLGLGRLALASPAPRWSDPAMWEPKVFLEEGAAVSATEAATLTRTVNGRDEVVLAVGPWLAGEWSARFESRAKLPLARATVRGRYRTERLAPLVAEVRVTFWDGTRKLGSASMPLGTATGWTEFVFPVRHPQPGANAMTIGVGLTERTPGRVAFAAVTAEAGAEALAVSPSAASHRPPPPARLQRPVAKAMQRSTATPRWWLERSGGAWWLVSPVGQPAYSSGVSAPASDPLATLPWLAAHGFNSLDGWSNLWAWARVMPDPAPLLGFQALESGTLSGGFDRLVNAKGETCGDDGHAFPDPYDPRFERAYRAAVKDVLRATAEKAWFAAWFADNEVAHEDLPRHLYSAGTGKAFVRFLSARYGTVDRLNLAWSRSFASFAEVLVQRPDPAVRRGALWEDCRAFTREVVQAYINVTLKVLREEDPGRLVFSNRFMLDGLGDTLDVIDLYARYDGIAVNCYPANLTAGLSSGEREALTLIYARTGKPILIGEWSVPAIDSGLYPPGKPLDWSWAEVVDTQTQRAAQAARVAADFYDLPFVVGAHWFIWKDVDTPTRRANRGIFKANGEPWPELAEALGAAQRRILAGTRSD